MKSAIQGRNGILLSQLRVLHEYCCSDTVMRMIVRYMEMIRGVRSVSPRPIPHGVAKGTCFNG